MFGIYLLFSPLLHTLSLIPFLGYLLSHGFSAIILVFAFLASVILTFLTISLAWLYYRPVLSVLMLSALGVSTWALMTQGG
jgi:hypothetical protein